MAKTTNLGPVLESTSIAIQSANGVVSAGDPQQADDGIAAFIDENQGLAILKEAFKTGRVDTFGRKLGWMIRNPVHPDTGGKSILAINPLLLFFVLFGLAAIAVFVFFNMKL